MKTYNEVVLPAGDVAHWRMIKAIWEALPDIRLPLCAWISCHHLAHAFARIFPAIMAAEDGYFLRIGQEHSWLRLVSGNIVDIYPIAVLGGPFLADASHYGSPWFRMYVPCEVDAVCRPGFANEVSVVADAIRKTMIELKIEGTL